MGEDLINRQDIWGHYLPLVVLSGCLIHPQKLPGGERGYIEGDEVGGKDFISQEIWGHSIPLVVLQGCLVNNLSLARKPSWLTHT